MHVSLVSFGGMVLVALSVLGTGAPCFSSIPLTVSDHFVLLSVHAIAVFGIIFWPHFPIPRTPYISFALGLLLRYCRNVRPTWVKFDSKDTKESEWCSRF